MALKRLGSSKGVVMVLLTAAAVCAGFVYLIARERSLNTELSGTVASLKEEQVRWEQAKSRLEQTLKDKEAELEIANTKNYRADMVQMQDAFKEANQKLQLMIRERAELENTNFILDSRLKNTTGELTKSLEELRQARALLGGIENPYKVKMVQLSENLKKKEEEYLVLQKRLEEVQRALMAYEAQGEEYSQGARKYQERLEVLSGNIANLKMELVEKNRLLSQKDVALTDLRREMETAQTAAEQQKASGAVAGVESERKNLQAQISASSAELAGQEQALEEQRQNLTDLRDKLYDREAALAAKERELSQNRTEMDRLKAEIAALRSGKEMLAKGTQDVAQVRRELDRKIRDLEKENASLQKKLAEAQVRSRGGQQEDPFKDRNLRLMTEQLVKKEDEIRGLAAEIATLTKEKKAWEKSFGPREKRMAELEILVNTLTKQLGDYAAMIEKRDAELRASAKNIASLTEDLEAQKMAALALQKELAEARSRQERTLQKLTQLMSMNTDGVGPDDMDFNLYGQVPGADTQQEKPEDPSKVRSRVEKLKRQVEVLMEHK